jgi:peptide/nickel transport system substrate-binding protein
VTDEQRSQGERIGVQTPSGISARRLPRNVVALGFLAAAAGCSSGGEEATYGRDPRTLIVGRPADALSLDPGRASDSESVEVCEQIYDSLLRYDPATGAIEPGLAESWKVSEDGTVWTFQLRPGVTFHDGNPLTAEAVVFSFERQRDPDHPLHEPPGETSPFAYWASSYQNIRRVQATGPLTVEIEIDSAFAPFAENMTLSPVAIVSPSAVAGSGAAFSRRPVGTGPYRFREWGGDRIVLERNADYWGPPPSMQYLVFQAISDPRRRRVALESRAIDVAYQLPPESLPFVALHPGLELHEAPVSNVAYLAMNTVAPPWDDLRVRRALNHAIDRTPIVKLAYRDQATAATGPLPPGQWGHHPATTRYRHDPGEARALLSRAQAEGVFDPERTYTLYAPATPRPYLPDPELAARIVAAQLEEVGLTIELHIQPVAAHLASIRRGEHDLCINGWVADTADPDNVLYTLMAPENARPGIARNVAFYRDPELGALLAAARKAERPERDALYARAQERIADQAPWVPLAHAKIVVAARSDLRDVSLTWTGHINFSAVSRRE